MAELIINGPAANANAMNNRLNTLTGGEGNTWLSNHANDPVGILIGGNLPTGGVFTLDIVASHNGYGPNARQQWQRKAWGGEGNNTPVLIGQGDE